MKKIALSLILACGVAMATEANATAPAAEANKTAPAAEANKTAAAAEAAKASTLFNRCAGCHGVKAEKKALNASQVIAGWDAAKTEKALKGYKDGSYGGAMKGVMKGQVAALSDEDIKALAEYIATLK
jgi:cytochrome c553